MRTFTRSGKRTSTGSSIRSPNLRCVRRRSTPERFRNIVGTRSCVAGSRRRRPPSRPRRYELRRLRARGKDMKRPSLSIGIEEEYQTIDPETRDLRSHIQMEILPKAKLKVAERVKPEMHQAVVEVGSKVCRDIKEAREDMLALRREMISLASENGLLLGAASTHPFADWKVQEIYPDDRYKQVVEDMQLVARANLVFGLHVHVGIEDRNTAIHIMNSMRYFLPHILALSSNSPFWLGMETGFKSYRSKVFERFP